MSEREESRRRTVEHIVSQAKGDPLICMRLIASGLSCSAEALLEAADILMKTADALGGEQVAIITRTKEDRFRHLGDEAWADADGVGVCRWGEEVSDE